MTREELDVLTQRYLQQSFDEIENRLALDWTPDGLEEYSFHLNERCHDLSGELADGDLSSGISPARELAPHADELSLRKLARRIVEVQLQAAIAEVRAVCGEPLDRPGDTSRPYVADAKPPPKATPRLSQVAQMYAEERIAQGKWSPKTAEQGRKIFALITHLLADPQVGDVTKADIRALGLDLTRLPANMTKKFPDRTAREVLDLVAERPELKRMEPRSVNKHYQHVRSLFAWAAEHDHIPQSPATVLHDVQESRAQEARKAFTDEDITTLFAEIACKATEPYGLWIPRIMAFTGCRMGEAAQLRRLDIRQEQGIWIFDFNDDADDKSLKTEGSARHVPIHPRLIELGVLELADGSQDDYLFPQRVRVTDNPIRGNVDRLSKQLSRWLRGAGILDDKKTFQSFRGTFSTRLKDLGVPEYQIAELMGHENDNITTGRYGKRTNLAQLHQVISRLQLPI